jgi:hypothetical protein
LTSIRIDWRSGVKCKWIRWKFKRRGGNSTIHRSD